LPSGPLLLLEPSLHDSLRKRPLPLLALAETAVNLLLRRVVELGLRPVEGEVLLAGGEGLPDSYFHYICY
jgi:hypothetical protein